ncbi:Flp family type IVb pilin [Sandaracinobacter sp. RS1-74]|uniref:Flp family type IVb pilin n=1 Tax=Sandaracinobacteroides sayramensis TaxID=2913411 RepID=UPI001EDA31D9|nr:Flp family type IVb pilin [Sandaracinobacteroides sayramensis]MCG2840575.1 Flp family type IVb pilin [Sandaracinobacteroides sayramensis]
MKNFMQKLLSDKSGASAAEYGLILAVIGGLIIVGITALGNNLNGAFQASADKIKVESDKLG